MSGRVEHWSDSLFADDPILEAHEGWEDPWRDYDFDVSDIVRTARGWFIVSDSGCSCFGPGESPEIDFGPGTLEELRDFVEAEYGNNLVDAYYREKRIALLNAVAEASA